MASFSSSIETALHSTSFFTTIQRITQYRKDLCIYCIQTGPDVGGSPEILSVVQACSIPAPEYATACPTLVLAPTSYPTSGGLLHGSSATQGTSIAAAVGYTILGFVIFGAIGLCGRLWWRTRKRNAEARRTMAQTGIQLGALEPNVNPPIMDRAFNPQPDAEAEDQVAWGPRGTQQSTKNAATQTDTSLGGNLVAALNVKQADEATSGTGPPSSEIANRVELDSVESQQTKTGPTVQNRQDTAGKWAHTTGTREVGSRFQVAQPQNFTSSSRGLTYQNWSPRSSSRDLAKQGSTLDTTRT